MNESERKEIRAAKERERYARLKLLGLERHKVDPERSRAANRKSYEKRIGAESLAKKREREADPEGHRARMAALRVEKEKERQKGRVRSQESKDRRRKLYAESKEIREKQAARLSEWYKNNGDKRSAYRKNRRARKLDATPIWFGEIDELVIIEAADLSRRREAVTGYAWHVDHMVPLQARNACGLHVAANIQVIPASMNISKGNRMVFTQLGEWVRHG